MLASYGYYLSLAWAAYILILIIWIIMANRPILATICWVLALSFIPYVGFIIYYFIGPQKLKRQKANIFATKQLFNKNYDLKKLIANNKELINEKQTQLAKLVYRTTNYVPTLASNFQLISGGIANYERLFADVEQAKHFVLLEYYIFEPGNIGNSLRDLLIKKLNQGLKVYLLIDAFGSARVNRRYMADFLAAGGRMEYFHNNILFPTLQHLRPALNMRTHRKILICDDKIATTGGINISDEQDERYFSNAYQDLNIRFSGPAVKSLIRLFMEDWHYTSGENISSLLDMLEPTVANSDGYYSLIQVLPSGPDNDKSPLLHVLLTTINQAQKRIWLTSPYFVPTEDVLFALSSAALRGVDVRVIVPEYLHSSIITYAMYSSFDALIKSGVKIYLYPASNLIHSKSILIDNFTIIGTSNFDNRSFSLNFELNVINYSRTDAKLLENQLIIDISRCKRFTQISSKRSFLHRLGESTARLLSPLL